jgi:hypothetical protein
MGTLGAKSTNFLGSVETECLLASGLRGLSKLSQRRDRVEQDLLSFGVSGGVQQSVGHAPGIGLYESSQVLPLHCSDGRFLISDPKVGWAVVPIDSGISFGSGISCNDGNALGNPWVVLVCSVGFDAES